MIIAGAFSHNQDPKRTSVSDWSAGGFSATRRPLVTLTWRTRLVKNRQSGQIWLETTGHLANAGKNKPSREVSVTFDFSKQDPKVISLLMDSCVNGISLSDVKQPDMPLVYVNESFERMTGYRKEEILGRNCRFLQGNDRDQECIKGIHEAINNKLPFECEIKNYKNNGKIFYNNLTISPIFDPASGELIYYLGIQLDITRQLIAIEEIKRLNKYLEDYIRHGG
jgi:PAS domain S-box-containing protein